MTTLRKYLQVGGSILFVLSTACASPTAPSTTTAAPVLVPLTVEVKVLNSDQGIAGATVYVDDVKQAGETDQNGRLVITVEQGRRIGIHVMYAGREAPIGTVYGKPTGPTETWTFWMEVE